jgi:hypothetical protein
MIKEYADNIYGFVDLEKALNKWFNVFKRDVYITNEHLISIASLSKFTYSVKWNFDCSGNEITSLAWCPKTVEWDFYCSRNKLTSLEWCPESVWWNFVCYSNNLSSLKWIQELIFWDFDCSENSLTSLELCPNVIKWRVLYQHNNFIPLEKKKETIFKLWGSIYIWSPNNKDVLTLIKCDFSDDGDGNREKLLSYYNSFINFIKSTVKLNKNDITDTDIIFNGKKFKKKYLNL